MELVVTGTAGQSGALKIYQNEETRKKLLDRYPKSFFTVLGQKSEEPVPEEGALDMEEATEGGVFAAMWRLLKRNKCGADFHQRKIPLLQQTVEICETFGLDPYRLEAEGCFVILCESGQAFTEACRKKSIPCSVIGFTEKGPAIRRTDGETVAYLRRPENRKDDKCD